MELFPPDSPFVDIPVYIKSQNEKKGVDARGYTDIELWGSTTINGYAGMQIESGFNYTMPRDGPVRPEYRETRPAVVIWCDPVRQVRVRVFSPLEAKLSDLRLVVDSMY